MGTYHLSLSRDGEEMRRFFVGEDKCLIGRAQDADLFLDDEQVSSRHAEIRVDDGRLFIKRQDPSHGVAVNGRLVECCALSVGDSVEVGPYVIQVHTGKETLGVDENGARIPFEAAKEVHDRIIESREPHPVPVLYRTAQLLGKRSGLDTLLPEILSVAVDALPARRGMIVTRFRDGAPPEVGASAFRGEGAGHPPVNQTLVDSVLEEGTAILTSDGAEGQGGTRRGAMCAPLCGRERTLGAIYVDSGGEPSVFAPEHLQLLSAIGHVAGMAVENELQDQERLEQERFAAIGEAVAGITHYMRNILTGIKGGLDLMAQAQSKVDWQQISFGLGIAHSSLGRFENLVVDLLTYARKGELTRGPVCVNELVREVFETVRSRAERFQVVLTFREGFVSEMDLDGNQIHRVLLNLVQNAIDACEQTGGAVEVSTEQNATHLVIRVRDTGMGIPRENLSKLSQAFFTTKSGRGTGLGLACSYRIVEQHGGRVTVESEPGEGATFMVSLPIHAELGALS